MNAFKTCIYRNSLQTTWKGMSPSSCLMLKQSHILSTPIRFASNRKRVVVIKKTPQKIKSHSPTIQKETAKLSPRRTSSRQSEQESLPSASSKPFVQFDLKRLPSLSGYDKIELFRDFLKTKQVASAVQVYDKLEENGIITRLQYADHNKLLKQLTKRQPNKYRYDILKIFSYISRLSPPNLSTLKLLLECACSWKDIAFTLQILELVRKGGHNIDDIQVVNSILALFSEFGIAQCKEGISFWNVAEKSPRLNRNLETYGRIMILYAKLGDNRAMQETYQAALRHIKQEDTKEEDAQVQLSTYLMNGFRLTSIPDAKAVYFDLIQKGIFSKVDRVDMLVSRDFFLQAMMIAHKSGDPAWGISIFDEMLRRGIRPDVQSYIQLLLIHALSNDQPDISSLENIFDRAMAERSVESGSISHARLLEAFSYASLMQGTSGPKKSLSDLKKALEILKEDSLNPSQFILDFAHSDHVHGGSFRAELLDKFSTKRISQ